jgi:L-amino acid N-acyltransferase YncA
MIRPATADDLPAILAIVNHEILTGTAFWVSAPTTLKARREWMEQRRQVGHPVLVIEQDGVLAGFGSYGSFRPQDGYARTVEHSLYIAPAFQRRGLGDRMLASLVEHATRARLHVMIGAIASENARSIALHERHGFVAANVLPQVGRKFDRWLDLVLMHRQLG